MEINDLVRFRERIGVITEVKVINLSWTSYTLCKVEFEHSLSEWINKMYLVKLVKDRRDR